MQSIYNSTLFYFFLGSVVADEEEGYEVLLKIIYFKFVFTVRSFEINLWFIKLVNLQFIFFLFR